MKKFCFVKFPDSDELLVSDLVVPADPVTGVVSIGKAIMAEIDKGPVEIRWGGKTIGQVTGYKIVRKKLKYILVGLNDFGYISYKDDKVRIKCRLYMNYLLSKTALIE